jgi:hypothetical protein
MSGVRPLTVRRALLGAARRPVVIARSRTARHADGVLFHYPKSGSTWLRMMVVTVLTGEAPDFEQVRRQFPPLGDPFPDRSPMTKRLAHTHEAPHRSFVPRRVPAVYLVRDPRDGFVSYLHHRSDKVRAGAMPEPAALLEAFLDGTINNYGRWDEHAAAGLARSQVVVRYEDLVADPRRELLRVMRGWGVDHVPQDALDRAVESNRVEAVRRREDPAGRSAGFVRAATVGDHETTLPAPSAQRIEAMFGPTMRRFGYQCPT